MIKIINGKKYNTETAEELCVYRLTGFSDDYGLSASEDEDVVFDEDIDYEYVETLYRKKTGELFLSKCIAGDGTADNFARGAKIKRRPIAPLDEVAGKKWVEAHGTAELYISLFGDVDE